MYRVSVILENDVASCIIEFVGGLSEANMSMLLLKGELKGLTLNGAH